MRVTRGFVERVMTDCVPVRGIYGVYSRSEAFDAPAWGHLDFYPNTKVLIDTEGVVVGHPKLRVTLDRNGCFNADLLVTDDPFWKTQGWEWKVDQFICGRNIGTAYFELPQGDGEPIAILDRMHWGKSLYQTKYSNPPESIMYKGELADVADLPLLPENGWGYVVQGKLLVWDNGEWVDLGPIVPGPEGKEGPRGPCGPPGVMGPQGGRGYQSTIEIGNTDTLPYPGPASVTDRIPADPHNAILDFQLVEGPVGPEGPQGLEGAEGPPGSGLNYLGDLNDVADLPFECDHRYGDGYIINGEMWVLSQQAGTACGEWLNMGPIQGPPGVDGDGAVVTIRDTVTLPPGMDAEVSDQNSEPHLADLVFKIPAGETGPPGTGINFKGILPTYADLLALDTNTLTPGDCYGVEESPSQYYGLWVWFEVGGWFQANIDINGLASEDFVKDYVKDYVDAALAPRYMEDYQALLDQADGNWSGPGGNP